jgi:hypothetical protein
VKFNRAGYWLLALFGGLGGVMLIVGIAVGGMVGGIFAMIGGIWFLVALGLVLYNRQQGSKAEHERWLYQNGLAGMGTIVEAGSNSSVNDQPILKLVLDLEIPGQPPRRIEKKLLMSRFAAYRMQPGVVLPVHVNPDPGKAGDVLVRW